MIFIFANILHLEDNEEVFFFFFSSKCINSEANASNTLSIF